MKFSHPLLALAIGLNSGLALAQVEPKDASEQTRQANAAVLKELPFTDKQDFEDAKKGFIETLVPMTIKDAKGETSWDLTSYDFIKGEAPDTVNPSLWRIAELNLNNGLFKVTDRVYQIRGFDLSNMTIVETDNGLIVIDPLVTTEVAKAGLDLYYKNRPKKPVVAVIYTHSHADHYGGVKGVVSEEDVKSGKVKVIAPEGFLEEAVSENVLAGNAMSRRTLYQYGALLPRSARGQLDAGLGKTTSFGTFTLIPPTDTITKTGETRNIDGVDLEFQMAPGTEAPSEMLIWFPQFKMLNTAEDATHTLHNLYTLRGAQVRNAANWWKTLNQAINTHGDQVEVVIAQHHWPMWGQQRIVNFIADQRDMFKYIHDQSLNLANKGFTMTEIAEQLQLPDSTGKQWHNRGYYGSVNHDAKAIYQRYLGWYDSNPANLHPLPPAEAGKKYVEFMGGADAIITKAKASIAQGDYRWAAEVLKHVVFADPGNQEARNLQADAFEQLGYQTENPTWRNEYLMGAYELRNGVPKVPGISTSSADMVAAMSPDLLLDYLGVRINGPKAIGKHLLLNWKQPDGANYAVELRNGVVIYSAGKVFDKPDATLTVDKLGFAGLMMGGLTLDKEVDAGKAKVEGDAGKVNELLALLDTFPTMFDIVTP
ncbi:alkyl/aryl-sulfatase [Pseudomonas sp. NFR16]|uniref:alkyl/aryl-sulfatase n=1 Tax=Pseudomonas sp. NFR16 TaxID=1566248 RepID=UPI0008D1B25C|nr:alkyl sulfatase dimerization domain-containing protein [Pseudomonas sp. NFR16]SEI43209.1 Alkyl sulfatase BDS1, metallo-beta-lactamase superfamily [Pseudomonas sp. NFR16]